MASAQVLSRVLGLLLALSLYGMMPHQADAAGTMQQPPKPPSPKSRRSPLSPPPPPKTRSPPPPKPNSKALKSRPPPADGSPPHPPPSNDGDNEPYAPDDGAPTNVARPPLPPRGVVKAGITINVAWNKPASQHGNNPTWYPAWMCTNGNVGDFCHTNADGSASPWWVVDLGASYDVSSVTITNRADCCQARVANIQIRVGNAPMGAFVSAGILDPSGSGNAICRTNPAGALGAGATLIKCDSATVTGRYVSVQALNTKEPLNMAEVQVWGTPATSTSLVCAAVPGFDVYPNRDHFGDANGQYGSNYEVDLARICTPAIACNSFSWPNRYVFPASVTTMVASTGACFYMRTPTSPPAAGQPAISESKTFCWKDTYPRGVGTIPSGCPAGQENTGGLCYPVCPAGWANDGTTQCYSPCPSGYSSSGCCTCHIDKALTKDVSWRCTEWFPNWLGGACRWGESSCDSDYTNIGLFCALNSAGKPPPDGYSGTFLDPMKKSWNRGVGKIPTACIDGKQYDAGLCYKACNAGYSGIGPVCWGQSPPGWVGCGMGAARDSAECGQIIFDQVSSVGSMALDLATLGASSSSSAAVRFAKFEKMREALRANAKLMDGLKKWKNTEEARNLQTAGDIIEIDSVTDPEDILRMAAMIASLADPTGVAGTIAAYSYPKCNVVMANGKK